MPSIHLNAILFINSIICTIKCRRETSLRSHCWRLFDEPVVIYFMVFTHVWTYMLNTISIEPEYKNTKEKIPRLLHSGNSLCDWYWRSFSSDVKVETVFSRDKLNVIKKEFSLLFHSLVCKENYSYIIYRLHVQKDPYKDLSYLETVHVWWQILEYNHRLILIIMSMPMFNFLMGI